MRMNHKDFPPYIQTSGRFKTWRLLRFIRRSLLWPISFTTSLAYTLLGLDDPRSLFVRIFKYRPLAYRDSLYHSKFRNWFDFTTFGFYYSRGFWYYATTKLDKITKMDKILLRVRMSLVLPLEYCNALLIYDWMDERYWMTVKRYSTFLLASIKFGHCNHRRW